MSFYAYIICMINDQHFDEPVRTKYHMNYEIFQVIYIGCNNTFKICVGLKFKPIHLTLCTSIEPPKQCLS